MAYNPHSDKKGDWHCEKVLGSGGFGTVRLWKHKKNNELLALKECRLMLDDKNKRRWNTEIAIMQRLDHTNVVKAIKVPDVLQSNDGDIPHLGMEYCSGGDLRHLLNSAENCCGLKENMVRDIILQITSGIEYLHSKRIIHRDLKPENIVLQNLKQNKIQYKIIDLGYAKALDDGSVCSSFVGTLQYLAPELFSSKEYTRTVDYWSFGTVVFECIVGFRPFLSMLQPAKWHGIVKKKSSEHICVFFDMNGQPQFSSTLPNPNYLCQPFKENIEKWLRLLLEWIPRKRGGKMDEITKQPLVFSRIDLILHQKIAHIYCIHTNTLLSYVVSGNKSMQSFQEQLTKDTGIPIEKQELLFPSGASIDPRQPSLHLASQQLDGRENIVFLFVRSGDQTINTDIHLPELVQCLVHEPSILLPYEEQRKAWSHAVYFCSQQAICYQRQLESRRAAMMSLMRYNANQSKLVTQMVEQYHKFTAHMELFVACHEFDIDLYQKQAASGGVSSDNMYKSWLKLKEDCEKYQLEGQVKQLEVKSSQLQIKLMELQRSPVDRHRQSENVLQDIHEKAKDLYARLRQNSKEQTYHDSTDMQRVVVQCFTKYQQLTKGLAPNLSQIMQFRLEVMSVKPQIEAMIMELKSAISQLLSAQQKRQNDIWTLVRVAGLKMQTPPHQGHPRAELTPGLKNSPFSTVSPLRTPAPSLPGSSMVLSSLMAENDNEASMLALSENAETRNRFSSELNSLKSESDNALKQTKTMDWTFLEGQDHKI